MISWLIKKFVPDSNDRQSPKVRYAVGRICGYVGIFLNILLFAMKYAVGLIVNSVAIKADAVNNLTDAVNNIVSIISFYISEKPADKEHPYGHQRTETITALFMGVLIAWLGVEMLRQSIEKIIHNQVPVFHWSSVIVLCFSIVIKLIMYLYNRKYGKKYDSDLLLANALDSRNDVLGTVLVLVSAVISPWLHYDLDGVIGLFVSGIILYSAWDLMKSVINVLLGEAPSTLEMNQLIDIIMREPMIMDIHDVIFHSYGPTKTYATAHVEVDGTLPLIEVHNVIDSIERIVQKEMNVDLVIHVDPLLLNDKKTMEAEDIFDEIVEQCNPEWSIHDFRIEERPQDSTRVYFDLVVPYNEKHSEEEILELIKNRLDHPEKYRLLIRIEHPYS